MVLHPGHIAAYELFRHRFICSHVSLNTVNNFYPVFLLYSSLTLITHIISWNKKHFLRYIFFKETSYARFRIPFVYNVSLLIGVIAEALSVAALYHLPDIYHHFILL